jgi:hypothetical protein
VPDLLVWLQASGLGRAMRESGPWTYAVVNLIHILGIGTLFGSVVILDLRLLGVWRRVPLAHVADVAAPTAAAGFAVAATSGVCMLTANATDYVGNPFFLVKFPAIAIGFVNAVMVRRSAAWKHRHADELSAAERRRLAWMGGASLACWLTAVGAGRMIGYW